MGAVPAAELAARLRAAGVHGVTDDRLTRAMMTSDASLYRVVPAAVAFPRHEDELVAALEVCRELQVPLTVRGAGTSIAGNALGTGLVADVSRYMDHVVAVNGELRQAVVQPGVVPARLSAAAARYGLRFGPDPSTANRCTVGGMLGNNACGARSLVHGRTVDNVVALDVVTGGGDRLRLSSPGTGALPAPLAGLRGVVESALAPIRTELGRFPRQVSGYALEHLLPERGADVARALVGSEGTLAVVLGATVRLVPVPLARVLVVLGYPGMAAAGDAVPAILEHRPSACEGLDSRLVDAVRSRPGGAELPQLPGGGCWLLVELAGEDARELTDRARRVVAAAGAAEAQVVSEPGPAAAVWRIREDGAGLASRTPDGRAAYPGWEDAAVPPANLGAYLREFERLLADHRLHVLPYGHFGEGCLHVRVDLPLDGAGGPARLRSFVTAAARLVVEHGGSLSGEHGDGRARSELLGAMYSPALLEAFGRVKGVFDPGNVLNPGVVVAPRPLDADVRRPQAVAVAAHGLPERGRASLAFAYRADRGRFVDAVHRCTGIGRCRADPTGDGGVMCPSFLATREEKDSTRGRARVLQEMANGTLVGAGWRSPEVHAALELCLSCKGCARDCPTGVDMATYKAEMLHQSYRGRLRPRTHYTLGRLPALAALAGRVPGAPGALAAAFAAPGVGRAVRWAAGIDGRRTVPRLAARTFRQWWASRPPCGRSEGRPVVLWVDTFTDRFSPEVGRAAVRVLESAGYAIRLAPEGTCCALTWITTGQLDAARRILARTLAGLAPLAARDLPIVGLEPSCTAVLRSDGPELVGSAAADRVAGATRTLAELLGSDAGWRPPRLDGVPVLAQPHCHHASVLGWAADRALLAATGAEVSRVGGCCGLAGNFGMERGHYEVSSAVAGHALLPAVRAAAEGTVVLADGFSCRTQLADLAGVRAFHLAQLLAGELSGRSGHLPGSGPAGR